MVVQAACQAMLAYAPRGMCVVGFQWHRQAPKLGGVSPVMPCVHATMIVAWVVERASAKHYAALLSHARLSLLVP
jgi:uncharacterized membrane protein YbaN (DUF454 family)